MALAPGERTGNAADLAEKSLPFYATASAAPGTGRPPQELRRTHFSVIDAIPAASEKGRVGSTL